MTTTTTTTAAPARVLFITGGANGIGRDLVQRFLGQGAAVATIDPDRRGNADLTAAAARDGTQDRLLVIRGDVSREPVVRSALRITLRRFGRLDAVINNAALSEAHTGPVEQLFLKTWSRYLGIGLTGAFLCAKHATPALRRTRGAIINIASTRALQSEAQSEAYAATKSGIVALTHALAISLGPDIRVNCI
ncbi:MAG TPA: SDR family NAD(P)-dependent oxidoreductase, partial [Planctomycetota bacterium]|nr:SDR family NAD(P)-dependent oxidoreductase [Planctomycetota bacterium]